MFEPDSGWLSLRLQKYVKLSLNQIDLEVLQSMDDLNDISVKADFTCDKYTEIKVDLKRLWRAHYGG